MSAFPLAAHADLGLARDALHRAHAEMERAGHKDAFTISAAAHLIANLVLSSQEVRQ